MLRTQAERDFEYDLVSPIRLRITKPVPPFNIAMTLNIDTPNNIDFAVVDIEGNDITPDSKHVIIMETVMAMINDKFMGSIIATRELANIGVEIINLMRGGYLDCFLGEVFIRRKHKTVEGGYYYEKIKSIK